MSIAFLKERVKERYSYFRINGSDAEVLY